MSIWIIIFMIAQLVFNIAVMIQSIINLKNVKKLYSLEARIKTLEYWTTKITGQRF